MITNRQQQEFCKERIDTDLLDWAIGWIIKNLSPEDVFSDQELETWAKDNGFVEE